MGWKTLIEFPSTAWTMLYGLGFTLDRFAAIFVCLLSISAVWQWLGRRGKIHPVLFFITFLSALGVLTASSMVVLLLSSMVLLCTLAISSSIAHKGLAIAGIFLLGGGLLALSGGALLVDFPTMAMIIPQLPSQTLLLGTIAIITGLGMIAVVLPVGLDIAAVYIFFRLTLFLLTGSEPILFTVTLGVLLLGGVGASYRLLRASAELFWQRMGQAQLVLILIAAAMTLLIGALGIFEPVQALLFACFFMILARVLSTEVLLQLSSTSWTRTMLALFAVGLPGSVMWSAMWLFFTGTIAALPQASSFSVFIAIVLIMTGLMIGVMLLTLIRKILLSQASSENTMNNYQGMKWYGLFLACIANLFLIPILPFLLVTLGTDLVSEGVIVFGTASLAPIKLFTYTTLILMLVVTIATVLQHEKPVLVTLIKKHISTLSEIIISFLQRLDVFIQKGIALVTTRVQRLFLNADRVVTHGADNIATIAPTSAVFVLVVLVIILLSLFL